MQKMSLNLDPRYTLRKRLGEGGSGQVFHVYDSVRDLDLALKDVGAHHAAWLRREFGTLRSVRHENLVQVFDWGALPAGAYYTMELVIGGPWGEGSHGPQALSEVMRILAGVLRGLAHLHAHGEVHGDLKPGNVLLSSGGLVKVSDVGMGGGQKDGMLPFTTPGYTAPEVWEGAAPDLQTDIYSTAVMAFEALTGRHPFGARTVREVVSGQLQGWVPSPSAYGVQVPAHIERALMRALDRNPRLRPGSADEFMEGLGIDDRVGEILGGPVVGRQREVSRLEDELANRGQGRPVLIHVVGPPGAGQAALLDEAADRVAGRGMRAVAISAHGTTLPAFVKALTGKEPGASSAIEESLAAATELIQERTRTEPLFAWLEGCSEQFLTTILRPLARWLWAASLEGESSNLLIAIARTESQTDLDSFEQELRLEPLPLEFIDDQLSAFLGTVECNAALRTWLHASSGGQPGPLLSLIKTLIQQGIMSRERGTWVLRNTEELSRIHVPGIEEQWEAGWCSLADQSRDLLSAIALMNRGVEEKRLQAVVTALGSADVRTLEMRGWIRQLHGIWAISSEAALRTVLSLGAARLSRVARLIRTVIGPQLSREEAADLAILSERTADTLVECTWAAAFTRERGDVLKAARLYSSGLVLARELGDMRAVDAIALHLSETLLHLGDPIEAERVLKESWHRDTPERLLLLGRVRIAKGEFHSARSAFKDAVALADREGNRQLYLRSHAELSELEWRYGNDHSRLEAIERAQQILEVVKGEVGLEEEKAALSYGIGSALVVKGKPLRAKAILEAGLSESSSDFWRARLANALGAASGVRGENDAALGWYDIAWEHAERAKLVSMKARILANKGAIFHAKGQLELAVNLNRQAAGWARKMGNRFEYMAACAGTAIGLIYMGIYEDAANQARESSRCALELGDELDRIKGLELEALALFHMGAFKDACSLVEEALKISAVLGGTRLTGRVLWLKGRLERAQGDLDLAKDVYEAAERQIIALDDLEDLLGVQIELESLRLRSQEDWNRIHTIARLAQRGESAGLAVVHVSGMLAIAEILGENDMDHRPWCHLLLRTLERAEACGFYDVAWQLSYWLAEFALRDGDLKRAHNQFAHSVRMIRGIADRLSPNHRATYLLTPHVSTVFRSRLAN
jgi:tetratricopeptide (TPR) repeat protein